MKLKNIFIGILAGTLLLGCQKNNEDQSTTDGEATEYSEHIDEDLEFLFETLERASTQATAAQIAVVNHCNAKDHLID